MTINVITLRVWIWRTCLDDVTTILRRHIETIEFSINTNHMWTGNGIIPKKGINYLAIIITALNRGG
jgi:hypothetical protein